MRKAKLGRLEPVTDRPGGVRGKHIVGRTLADLPSDLVAKHEAAIRVNTAKRFAKQGALQRSSQHHETCTCSKLVIYLAFSTKSTVCSLFRRALKPSHAAG